MDKQFLIRLNDSYKQIRTRLLLNEKIRTYLYYDEIDENTEVPPIDLAKQHIFLQPIITTDVVEPFNKKNYISITVPNADISNSKVLYTVRIIVMSEKTCWEVNGDIRPLILSQEIVNELEGLKLDLATKLSFSSMVETVTNKDVSGYSLLFTVADGIGKNDDKK